MQRKRGRDQEIVDYQEDADERRQYIGQTLFGGQLATVKQLFVFDLVALQRNTRQGASDMIENAALMLLCYLMGRIAYEANAVKHSVIMAIKLEYDGVAKWFQERWATRVARAVEVLGAREKYELEPIHSSRIDEFPAKLRPELSRPKSILQMMRLLQLHTVVPTTAECGADLWGKFWDSRHELGVKRWFFLAGRVRSASLRRWAIEYGKLDTLEDVEHFKHHFTASLSDVELTFELNTLPSDVYIRNSRLVEQFGTSAFEIWAEAVSHERTYPDMLSKTLNIWGLDMFVAKNILHFIAEGCHAAAKVYGFDEYPWVTSFFEHEPASGAQVGGKDGVIAALGPNPSVLCNLAIGLEKDSRADLKACRKNTLRAFQQIVEIVTEAMPSRVAFRTARGWETCEVPLVLHQQTWRQRALLALNMCKTVQVFDAWLGGSIRNPRRDR